MFIIKNFLRSGDSEYSHDLMIVEYCLLGELWISAIWACKYRPIRVPPINIQGGGGCPGVF